MLQFRACAEHTPLPCRLLHAKWTV